MRTMEECRLSHYPSADLSCHDKPICFLSDFGLDDPYVGIVKGVILSIAPKTTIIDITHSITPFDITQGGYILSRSFRHFPAGSIFLSVVDPGVGSSRKPIVARTENHFFVTPDNGILTPLMPQIQDAREITERNLFNPSGQSSTFHARDIFGPVAAHLSTGFPLEQVGPALPDLVTIPFPQPEILDGLIRGNIICFDRFGNGATNITQVQMEELKKKTGAEKLSVEVNSRKIPLGKTFSQVESLSPVALVNSFGDLEICINQGSAKKILGIARHTEVMVFPD